MNAGLVMSDEVLTQQASTLLRPQMRLATSASTTQTGECRSWSRGRRSIYALLLIQASGLLER